MLYRVQVRALGRPLQDLDVRALEECHEFPRSLARSIVMLEEEWFNVAIKWSSRRQDVIIEHPGIYWSYPMLSSNQWSSPTPAPGHAPPDIQGAPSSCPMLCRQPTLSPRAAFLFRRWYSHSHSVVGWYPSNWRLVQGERRSAYASACRSCGRGHHWKSQSIFVCVSLKICLYTANI